MNICEIAVSYVPKYKVSELPKVNLSQDCAAILRSSWNDNISYCEEFKIMLLNRANRVLGVCSISTGGLSGTVADPKMIFQTALKCNASSIILCHNHPSGNLKPSQADVSLTQKITGAGAFLEIAVLDHIILTSEGYYSFADEGMM